MRILENFFLFFFFIFLLSASLVNSVGIQSPQASDRLIIFQPNLEKQLGFALVNAEKIHSYKYAGVLDEYVTVIDPAQDTGPRSITAVIKLPGTLDPGKYEIMIGGQEIAIREGTVGALAAVQSRIIVLSLYPEAYPEFTLGVSDLGINQSATFSVTIENFGMQRITSAQAFISVYDPENTLVTTLTTDSQPVEIKLNNPSASTTLKTTFDASRYTLKPGIYRAEAKLVYDSITYPTTKEANFRLGTLNVYVKDWTREVFVNSTNKFQVIITSDWSSPIEDVYARITTPNNKVLKTPNLDLNKFSEATLETYLETEGLALGEHELTIEVFFQGKSTKTIAKVNITEGIPPVEEKPNKPLMNISLDTTTIVLILMVIILVFNVYFFMFKDRNNSPKQPPQQPPVNEYQYQASRQKERNTSLKPPKL